MRPHRSSFGLQLTPTLSEPLHVCACICSKRVVHPSGGHLETHTAFDPGLPVPCLSQGLYPIQVGGLPLEHSPSELVGFSSFISVEGSEPCTMIPGRSAAMMI